MELPSTAPCSWSGETLHPRYAIPKIWTQEKSRPFGIYWSDKLAFGRLWPEPTDDELAAFYATSKYGDHLSGTAPKPGSAKATILSRAVVKIAWHADHGQNDPISTIMSLRSPHTVCDLGCGSGAFLAAMK
jgi:hypothetical protein